MANTLKIKRGTAATIPQGQLAEPLFTTDTYDLYIGKGSGGNQRIQNYIASGTSSQFLKGDGSLDSNTYQTALTFSSPLVNTSGTVTINQSSGSVDGYLSSTDWTTFNSKEPAITAGTTLQYYRGDKTFQTLDTSVVPENGPIYFTEPRVRATVLTGLNLSGGGTIAATDSILTAFGKVQNQISALVGGATYQGTWNASTNTPTLASGTGTKGYYYVVSVAGSTNLDGITDWKIGDWAIFNGTTWDKVDNTDAVSSVNGFTGAVNLALDNISDVSAASPTNAQLLRFNGTSSLWENWTPTFEPALTKGNLTEATSSVLTITGGTGAVIGSGTTIEVASAGAAQNGVVTTGTQTFAGAKTFNSTVTASALYVNGMTAGNGAIYHTGSRLTFANYNASGTLNFEVNGGASAMTINADKTIQMDYYTTNGFVKFSSSNGTLTVDTNTYLTTSSAASTYLPLSGGTITGTLITALLEVSTFTSGNAMVYSSGKQLGTLTGTDNTIAYWSGGTISSLLTATYPSLTELSYVKGVTSAIQTQLNGKVMLTGNQTISGIKEFTDQLKIEGDGTNATAINFRIRATASVSGNGYSSISATTDRYNFYTGTGASTSKAFAFNYSSITDNTTRVYTMPNATGTIALTSDLSAYLPLTGGTLTGALSGTSATFSGLITSTRGNSGAAVLLANSATTGGQKIDLINTSGRVMVGIEDSVGGSDVNGAPAYSSYLSSVNAQPLVLATNNTVRFTISSTGAATFSSSVTAGGAVYAGATSRFAFGTSGAERGGIVLDASYNWTINTNGVAGAMYIASATGNVGIGTTSPTNGLLVLNSTAANGVRLALESSGTMNGIVALGSNAISGLSTTDMALWTRGVMAFETGASGEKMRITTGGNVGIGTTSPSSLLHMVGASATLIVADNTSYAAGVGGKISFQGNYRNIGDITEGGYIKASKTNATNGDYGFDMIFGTQNYTAGVAERMRITSGGDIQTNGGKIVMNINASTQTIWAGGYGGGIQLLRSDATSTRWGKFGVLDASGNWVGGIHVNNGGEVLINTETDSGAYYLQVNGSVYATAYYESSDIRLKDVLTNSYSENFSAIEFMWKDKRDDKKHWGYAAQDVMKYIPDAIEVNKDGMMTVNYNEAHTWKIAQLEAKIVELEAKLK